jgi:plastocyanin
VNNYLKRASLVIFIIISLIAVVSLSACSSGNGASTTKTSTQSVSGNTINIINFTFTPVTLTVSVGTTVTWTNNDSTTHRPVSDTGVFDGGNLATNATFSFTFNTAGTFPYHCSIHPSMTGTVIVK